MAFDIHDHNIFFDPGTYEEPLNYKRLKNLYLLPVLLLWIGCSFLGLSNLSLRPALPVAVEEEDNRVALLLETGDQSIPDSALALLDAPASQTDSMGVLSTAANQGRLVKIGFMEKHEIHHLYEVKNILALRHIGESVEIRTLEGRVLNLTLVPAYTFWELFVKGLVGMLLLTIATLMWIVKTNKGEQYFALSLYGFGFIVMTWWPGLMLPHWLSIPLVILYFLSFSQAIFFFVYFSHYFPLNLYSKIKLHRTKIGFRFIGITVSVILLTLLFMREMYPSPETMLAYEVSFQVFKITILLWFGYALVKMVVNQKKVLTPVSHRKLHWILAGIFWALAPFIFLRFFPWILGWPPVMPIWIFNLFLLLPPLCITIAILKYRLLDIESILFYSLVYGILVILIISMFITVTRIISGEIYDHFTVYPSYYSIVVVLLAAALFNPAKKSIEKIVERHFFPIRYQIRECLKAFEERLKNCASQEQIAAVVSEYFKTVIQVQDQILVSRETGQWRLLIQPNTGTVEILRWLQREGFRPMQEVLIGIDRSQHLEIGLQLGSADFPSPWVIMFCIGEKMVWLMTEKQSGMRFWKEDIDFGRTMARMAYSHWKRLKYFRQVFGEELEKEADKWQP